MSACENVPPSTETTHDLEPSDFVSAAQNIFGREGEKGG